MISEKQKMLSGQPYDPTDKLLTSERHQARAICKELNTMTDASNEERQTLLAKLFGACGESLWIEPPFYCDYGANISVGDNVFFNFNCVVLDPAPVQIGNHVLFGPAVQIYTATHPLDAVERRSGLESAAPIEIGSDVWVGGGAIICPGTKIGRGSVIGAGSVVTRNIPAGVFAAGNPCRVIRDLEAPLGKI